MTLSGLLRLRTQELQVICESSMILIGYQRLEEKIWRKHKLLPEMIEACFYEPDPKSKVRNVGGGKYILYTHSSSGEYLFIVFAYKIVENWRFVRIISARPMEKAERALYRSK